MWRFPESNEPNHNAIKLIEANVARLLGFRVTDEGGPLEDRWTWRDYGKPSQASA
jgi:hypothetical protein